MERIVTGRWLETKRKAAGLSTRRFAEKAGISHVYVRQLENGENSPTLELWDRILAALGVSWLVFLTETGYVKKPRKPR